jgi:hypothetical protein
MALHAAGKQTTSDLQSWHHRWMKPVVPIAQIPEISDGS